MTSTPLAVSQVPLDESGEATSQKRVEANQRNAQLSTGPKTVEGKKISSCNAAKHGLLVKDVVINTRGNKEDQAEFDALLAQMRNAYAPVDIVEDLLVQEIAISYWRSARALRCERGDVTCAGAERKQDEISAIEISILTVLPAADAHHSLLRSPGGIKLLLNKIEQARDEVGASGSLSTELRRWLDPAQNWDRLSYLGKKNLLDALEKETEDLTEKQCQFETDELQWRNDSRDCSAIPSKDVLDRIYRYETSNVRHRYKVEARIEQLQARRRENAKVNSGRESDSESS
jgi:hypothetical protein